jgi:hypothetical protein
MDLKTKLASFSRNQKECELWSNNFFVKAKLRGYCKVLTGIEAVDKRLQILWTDQDQE